jgi:DNA-binding response OmpR family regulator
MTPNFPATLETILLVEDDPLVLGFLNISLTRAGFCVLSAGSPEEARRIESLHAG